jgi:hypothetical protein
MRPLFAGIAGAAGSGCTGATANVTLTTMGASYVKIATLLRAKGVRVSGDDNPDIEPA